MKWLGWTGLGMFLISLSYVLFVEYVFPKEPTFSCTVGYRYLGLSNIGNYLLAGASFLGLFILFLTVFDIITGGMKHEIKNKKEAF